MNAFKLSNTIDPEPLALSKEVRRAHPLHERPITNASEGNDPLRTKLQFDIISTTETPEMLPPPTGGLAYRCLTEQN